MEIKHVKTFEGAPEPSDIFEPHRLGVELLSDMDEVFKLARRRSNGEGDPGAGDLPAEAAGELASHRGGRSVAIVTPGRLTVTFPAPPPGSAGKSAEEAARKLMPPDPPLNITAVSYTHVKALLEDKSRAIPFLGFLLGFAAIGHTVVVFEGHPSAFESGVRGSDVLLVDSAMLPFLQDDWVDVAFKAMRPGAKIFVHEREHFSLLPVARSNNAQGWRYTEMDGEASYANSLLTVLARGTSPEARVTSGRPLPDLAGLTTDPDDLDWIAGMPFKYDRLNADEVIKVILHAAGWHVFKKTGVFRAGLATGGGELVPVLFTLTLTKDADGRRQLLIER